MKSNWQTELSQFNERALHALVEKKFCDVNFLVGVAPEQRIIPCHKFVLAIGSPVFEIMFFGNVIDDGAPIIVPDAHPEIFEKFLKYLYSDQLNISDVEEAIDLCYVAHKYMIPHLAEECENFILQNINVKSACHAFELAQLFEKSSMKSKCMKFIAANAQQVLSHPNFNDVDASTLLAILDEKALNIRSELQLCDALCKVAKRDGIDLKRPSAWAQISINDNDNILAEGTASASDTLNIPRRLMNNAMLREGVSKIRFLTLTPQQFADGPACTQLLNPDQRLAVFRKICNPRTDISLPEGLNASRSHRGHK